MNPPLLPIAPDRPFGSRGNERHARIPRRRRADYCSSRAASRARIGLDRPSCPICRPTGGGVYVSVGLLWLWLVDDVAPQSSDYLGVAMCLGGMAIIMWGPRS